jgi:hypothetical protein
VYRGYFPVVEGEPSRKEGFEFARDVHPDDTTVDPNNWFYEKSVWPDEDGTDCFKTFLKNMYETVHETSISRTRCFVAFRVPPIILENVTPIFIIKLLRRGRTDIHFPLG